MHVEEELLLVPQEPLSHNPDDWPTFTIKKIHVTSQQTGREVSLLSAHTRNPVNVSGKLDEIDDDLLHLVRDKRYRDKTIEINNVMTYAFAEYDDGTYGFWAAGKAGWFEIQSASSAFQDTYNKMNEAASIFYMLADKLKRSHNRRPRISQKATEKYAEKVFQDYLSQGRTSTHLSDVDDVREAFHEHRDFLITSMLEDQEGLNWDQTPMLNYFKWKFPDEYAHAATRIRGKDDTALPTLEDNLDQSRKKKSQSPEYIENNPSKKSKRGRPRSSELQQLHTPVTNSVADISTSGDERCGNPNVVTRKRKSILQPSGGKYSKKAAGRRQGPSAVATPDPDDLPIPNFLSRKYLELKVVQYELPSKEPQGPGDLWICTFEGCFHRVHEAPTTAGKKRIKEHFKTHATHAQEKIDLAINESRPYLPVNNLVRRLQAFASGPDVEPELDSLDRRLSGPIRRRY